MCPCQLPTDSAGCSRRDFLAGSTFAALGTLLASACGGATGPSPGFSGTFVVDVSDYPTLATVGGIALLDGAPTPMAAVRSGSTEFQVFSRICPHQGTTIGLSGHGFRCPNHGALFDAGGNNVGGQSTGPLTRYTAAYDEAANRLTISA